jgi:hypothetical protein
MARLNGLKPKWYAFTVNLCDGDIERYVGQRTGQSMSLTRRPPEPGRRQR